MHKIDSDPGGKHPLMVVEDLTVQAEILFHFFRFFRIDVAKRRHPAPPGEGKQPLHMGVGDPSGSNYRYIDHNPLLSARTFSAQKFRHPLSGA